MLQRTRADQVAPVFTQFDSRYSSAVAFGRASTSEIGDLLKPLGLKWRVTKIVQLSRELARRRGRLPRNQRLLENLPGVGPYAAAAALSLHARHRAVIIDSNIVRILARVTGRPFDAETRRKRWVREEIERWTPLHGFQEFNYGLLDLGAIICQPAKPCCPTCPINGICAFADSERHVDRS